MNKRQVAMLERISVLSSEPRGSARAGSPASNDTGFSRRRSTRTGNALGSSMMLLAVVALSVGGCHGSHGLSFTSELQSGCEVSTPSAEAVLAVEQVQTHETSPEGEQKIVTLPEQVVTHYPLYFEEPFEVKLAESNEVVWTGWDHAGILLGPFRFLVNLGLAPVSLVVEPPWREMASDGEVSRHALIWRRDAARYHAP